MTLLSVSSLNASLRGQPVLRDISLAIHAGEFVGLLGPNGAGKSTLLKSVLGLVPSSGTVVIAGRRDSDLSAMERSRLVAYLPQEREIAWGLRVEELVALGRTPYRATFSGPGQDDRAAIQRAMQRMEVEYLRYRPATELSGGEKARVLIARALAQEAPLLLADEPVAGLDPSHQIALMRVFATLAGEGHAIVASFHELGLAARWCSRLILIDGGTIVAEGAPQIVLSAERLRRIYGVEVFVGEVGGKPVIQPLDVPLEGDVSDH